MEEEQKPNFWKTPEGKIMSYGIHEYTSGLAYIGHSLSFIQMLLEKGKIEIKGTDELDIINQKLVKDFKSQLDLIKKGKDKCRDSMDYVYTKLKELQGL